ncbi:hypothetical protein ScPMuIL_007726 [Solemya velum]
MHSPMSFGEQGVSERFVTQNRVSSKCYLWGFCGSDLDNDKGESERMTKTRCYGSVLESTRDLIKDSCALNNGLVESDMKKSGKYDQYKETTNKSNYTIEKTKENQVQKKMSSAHSVDDTSHMLIGCPRVSMNNGATQQHATAPFVHNTLNTRRCSNTGDSTGTRNITGERQNTKSVTQIQGTDARKAGQTLMPDSFLEPTRVQENKHRHCIMMEQNEQRLKFLASQRILAKMLTSPKMNNDPKDVEKSKPSNGSAKYENVPVYSESKNRENAMTPIESTSDMLVISLSRSENIIPPHSVPTPTNSINPNDSMERLSPQTEAHVSQVSFNNKLPEPVSTYVDKIAQIESNKAEAPFWRNGSNPNENMRSAQNIQVYNASEQPPSSSPSVKPMEEDILESFELIDLPRTLAEKSTSASLPVQTIRLPDTTATNGTSQSTSKYHSLYHKVPEHRQKPLHCLDTDNYFVNTPAPTVRTLEPTPSTSFRPIDLPSTYEGVVPVASLPFQASGCPAPKPTYDTSQITFIGHCIHCQVPKRKQKCLHCSDRDMSSLIAPIPIRGHAAPSQSGFGNMPAFKIPEHSDEQVSCLFSRSNNDHSAFKLHRRERNANITNEDFARLHTSPLYGYGQLPSNPCPSSTCASGIIYVPCLIPRGVRPISENNKQMDTSSNGHNLVHGSSQHSSCHECGRTQENQDCQQAHRLPGCRQLQNSCHSDTARNHRHDCCCYCSYRFCKCVCGTFSQTKHNSAQKQSNSNGKNQSETALTYRTQGTQWSTQDEDCTEIEVVAGAVTTVQSEKETNENYTDQNLPNRDIESGMNLDDIDVLRCDIPTTVVEPITMPQDQRPQPDAFGVQKMEYADGLLDDLNEIATREFEQLLDNTGVTTNRQETNNPIIPDPNLAPSLPRDVQISNTGFNIRPSHSQILCGLGLQRESDRSLLVTACRETPGSEIPSDLRIPPQIGSRMDTSYAGRAELVRSQSIKEVNQPDKLDQNDWRATNMADARDFFKGQLAQRVATKKSSKQDDNEQKRTQKKVAKWLQNQRSAEMALRGPSPVSVTIIPSTEHGEQPQTEGFFDRTNPSQDVAAIGGSDNYGGFFDNTKKQSFLEKLVCPQAQQENKQLGINGSGGTEVLDILGLPIIQSSQPSEMFDGGLMLGTDYQNTFLNENSVVVTSSNISENYQKNDYAGNLEYMLL